MKNYRTWIEVSKKALRNNINQYKKTIGDNILAPVIKGNAYGHGLMEVARICQENDNVGWLCVATAEEALTLRKNNISKPILILVYMGNDLEQIALHNIAVTVQDKETIKKLHAAGKNVGKKCKIHIKIDTGLSRLGVFPQQALNLIKYAQTQGSIQVDGMWTHFAEAQEPNRTFTNIQISRFNNLIEKLEQEGIKIPIIHSSNSSGTTTVESKYENLFRVGVGIYGYWASEYIKEVTKKKFPEFSLQPVLSWKTTIAHIKKIPAGSFIGYMRTCQAKKDSLIANIPVGYLDGYDRRLSNSSHVIINNQSAKVVGLITMNIISVDVTNIKDVHIGNEVTLIGNTKNITASELGHIGNFNVRELTTRLNPTIPRIIVD